MPSRPNALVTGASRGIGRAVARELSQTHDVLLGARDQRLLRELADELPGARPWEAELTDLDAVSAAVEDIDRLDVLVHSAGVVELGSVAESSSEAWRRTFEVNVFAVVELTRLLLPALRAAGGHVVLINSTSGLTPRPNWGSYAASKFALRAFAEVLRAEEASHGIRVTSVFPGRTATDMQRGVRTAEGGEFEPENYLSPESVAASVLSAIRAGDEAHLTEIVVRP